MKIIDFSKGIRSEEINENFKNMKQSLEKERITVGGYGISEGFDMSIKDFKLYIKEGSLIDKNGQVISIKDTIINIEKPMLIEKIDGRKILTADNTIYLEQIPYASSRMTTCDNSSRDLWNIEISIDGMIGESSFIEPIYINKNIVYVNNPNNMYSSKKLNVKYFYTNKRRDVIYIDKQFKIRYKQGISMSTSSFDLRDDEYAYILAYIEVDPFDIDYMTQKPLAISYIVKSFKDLRNIYTDKDNNLFICGTPFSSIKTIHTEEPKNPNENTFWYDVYENKIKVWRKTDKFTFSGKYVYTSEDPNNKKLFKTNIDYLYGKSQLSIYVKDKKLKNTEYIEGTDLSELEKTNINCKSSEFQILIPLNKNDVVSYRIDRYDGFEGWVPVNDLSFVNAKETKMWTPSEMLKEKANKKHDYQYFFFDIEKDLNMLYVPNKGCLNIMIDQVVLHSDQFKEITLKDAIASDDAAYIYNQLSKYYGYEEKLKKDFYEEHENIGVGFKLAQPLDKESFVEVNVTQRINGAPLSKRFQRSATFIHSGTIPYIKYNYDNNIITINPKKFNVEVPYCYNENQLDIFVQGKKLIKNIEYIEGSDLEEKIIGASSKEFEILIDLADGELIDYKVSKNIYSYDHIEALFDEIKTDFKNTKDEIAEAQISINTSLEQLNNKSEELQQHINKIDSIETKLNNTISKNDSINKDMLSIDVIQSLVKSCFYHTITKDYGNSIDITNICSETDYLNIFNISSATNKVLIKDIDYNISILNNITYLNILKPEVVQQGHVLYLTGIKFHK